MRFCDLNLLSAMLPIKKNQPFDAATASSSGMVRVTSEPTPLRQLNMVVGCIGDLKYAVMDLRLKVTSSCCLGRPNAACTFSIAALSSCLVLGRSFRSTLAVCDMTKGRRLNAAFLSSVSGIEE